MSIDGVFIHFLVKELTTLENKRINKIYDLSEREFLFNISSKEKLIVSLNLNHAHIRITSKDYSTFDEPSKLCMVLRKHLERGIIEKISQFNNDRIVIIKVRIRDELGYEKIRYLILELMGRHANLILTNEDYIIIECLRKTPLDSMRIIFPKVKYEFPNSLKVNPFEIKNEASDLIFANSNLLSTDSNKTSSVELFEGISNILRQEIIYKNSMIKTITQDVKPTIFINQKTFFYCFDLISLSGHRLYFNSLSEMLDYYFTVIIHQDHQNKKYRNVTHFLKKEINKTKNKIAKQENELITAKDNLIYEKLGNLLKTNLHQIKPAQDKVLVYDYYNNNQPINIDLDPSISIVKNLENFFNKYKKAKRTIEILSIEIIKSKDHLDYLNVILSQVNMASNQDIDEIIEELGIQKNRKTNKKKKMKPNYLTFQDEKNNIIYVGKNNVQNNYLTHKLAHSNDYFFHVKNYPGSHTIVRTNNLSDELITLAAQISAYYSTKNNAKVDVDYTLVKNVKKVKNRDGSFVIYNNFKTTTVLPDINYINPKVKQINHDK